MAITIKPRLPPTYLDYFFTVRDGRIVTMIVIKNKEKSAK